MSEIYLEQDRRAITRTIKAGMTNQAMNFSGFLSHLVLNNLINPLEFGLGFGANSPNFFLKT